MHAILLTCLAWLLSAGAADAKPPARGSQITFWGWSPDSRLVAYTRLRSGRTRPDQRMHRFVEDGRFSGFGKMVGGDVERYAGEHGYRAVAAPKTRAGERQLTFVVGEHRFTLSLEIGRVEKWRFAEDDVVLGEHAFDRIYVGFDAELYAAPDATQAVLVMHLDTGWEIDAAIFPVPLSRAR